GDLHPSTWLHDESTIRRHLVPASGPLSLREVDVTRANEFRRRLVAAGLSGKSITNLIGTLHKTMADAVAEGFIATNPVLRIRSGRRRRAGARVRAQSDPLTAVEIAQFLATVPVVYRPLYDVWFRLGWRSSEIVAVALPEPGLRPSRVPRRYRPDAALRRDRGRAEDRAARGRLLQRPGHLRPARRDPQRQEAWRAGRLRVHGLRRAAALAGMAPQAGVAPDAAASGPPCPGSVQRPRQLHLHRAVSRRRSRVGRQGVRHVRGDDLPPLPHLDSRPQPRRRAEGEPRPGDRERGEPAPRCVPRGVPSAEINGRSAARSAP